MQTPANKTTAKRNPAGSLIRKARRAAGFSQMDLEVAIDASPGSISRIENGKVNPSKETLHAIAEALKLNYRQKVDLFQITSLLPTPKEIESAREESEKYIGNDTCYAYLLDEWGRIHAASKQILKIFGITREEADKLWGKNLLELLLDPNLPVRKAIDPDFYESVMIVEIKRSVVEMYMEDLESFTKLLDNPEFAAYYQKSKELPDEIVYSPQAKQTFLIVDGKKFRFSFSRENLKQNTRFRIIELFNPQPYE